jgi:Fe-S oxidoreductase
LILVIVAAVGFFMRQVMIRVRLVKKGKLDEKRFDRPAERILYTGVKVMSQSCATKDRPLVGLMHAFVFWGFMLFTVATINHVGGAFFKDFSLVGHGWLNNLWFLGVDVVAVFTSIGVLYLAVRRYIVKPEGITQPQPISKSWQSGVVLSLIFGLMVTYLFGKAAEAHLSGEYAAAWMPFSRAVEPLFAGLSTGALEMWNHFFWWSHILMVLGFLVLIPHSKHLHLIAGPVNIFLRTRKPIGTLEKIDFEKTEEFGVRSVTQYQWKNIMDFFSCLECGRCQDVCPAFQSGKPLSPKVVMMSLRKHILNEKDNLLKGLPPGEQIISTWVKPDEFWACTTCGACMEACPVMNEHIPAIVELRRSQVMMDSAFPQELGIAFRGLETNANPWNMGATTRADWSDGLNIPIMAQKQEAEYLWFVGCAGSFDDRGKQVTKALAAILNAAGVDYAILGTEEKCCGDPARRSGNEYVFQMMAQENIQTFQKYKFSKILTSCPHGYHMIKNEYSQFGGPFEVVHHTELLAQLIAAKRLNLSKDGSTEMTFHDSCYLGRYNQIYDAPRDVLAAVQQQPLKEMSRCGSKSFCCGAGGARMFMEEKLGTRINQMRIDQVTVSGAGTVGVACPFCMVMLDDGVKEKGLEAEIKVLDIAQIVAQRIVR